MDVAEELRYRELNGVIVKLENHWITISIILPAAEIDSFEIRLENIASAKVLKLGLWVILHKIGQIYQIVRQCSEILPTYVYKNLVLLRTIIFFQEKKQEGYGRWVWSPELGKVSAVCHERYRPKQDYVALVARKPAKYQHIVEYNWVLTKYVEEPHVSVQFDIIFHEYRICSGQESRFNENHEIHFSSSEISCPNNAVDGEHLFFEDLEEKKRENSISNNIHAVIAKVVANPNVRIVMRNYRPMEVRSICEALNLRKFEYLLPTVQFCKKIFYSVIRYCEKLAIEYKTYPDYEFAYICLFGRRWQSTQDSSGNVTSLLTAFRILLLLRRLCLLVFL